jgi:hypothetical protein
MTPTPADCRSADHAPNSASAMSRKWRKTALMPDNLIEMRESVGEKDRTPIAELRRAAGAAQPAPLACSRVRPTRHVDRRHRDGATHFCFCEPCLRNEPTRAVRNRKWQSKNITAGRAEITGVYRQTSGPAMDCPTRNLRHRRAKMPMTMVR